jgi:hypothetical protein
LRDFAVTCVAAIVALSCCRLIFKIVPDIRGSRGEKISEPVQFPELVGAAAGHHGALSCIALLLLFWL